MEENINLKYKAVVIGGSAGSLVAILDFLPFLKPDLQVAIIIVLHRKQIQDSLLTTILSAKTKLKVKEASEKEQIQKGTIYIAPPNYHLLIERDHTFSLDDSEKVNYSRPSIDITFESAAYAFGAHLAGILLSGANADGTEGLKTIKEENGLVVIQKPSSAEIPFMPANAIGNILADHILTPAQIGEFINNLLSY